METKVAQFVRIIRDRNVRETVAGVVVLVAFGGWLYGHPGPVVAVAGKTIVILGVFVALAVLWGWLHIPGSELAAYPPAEHPERWRRLMTLQARLLRLAWLWYVLPLVGGAALVALFEGPTPLVARLVVGGVMVAVGVGVAWLNVVAARGIERDRDAWLGRPGAA